MFALVRHHVREEENELFPKIDDEGFNIEIVGRMWERKQELMESEKFPHPGADKARPTHAGRAHR